MNGYVLTVLMFFVLSISLFATLYPPAGLYVKQTFYYLSELGWLGYLLLVCLDAAIVFCSIPIIIANLALSVLFSFVEAFLISMAGYALGVSAVYGIMRVCKWNPSGRFRRLYEAMKREPYKYTLLVRFILMPSALKNYGLASCPISYVCYLACAVVHGMCVNGLQIATAYQLWHAESLVSYVVVGCLLFVGLSALILFSYFAYRALRRAESHQLIHEQGTNEVVRE